MKNNLSLKLLIIVAGFGYAPASWSAIECSTRLLNLPPNEFQSWVVQMSRSGQAVDPESSDTSGCADFILGDYPSLQFVSPGSDPLTASNYYIAALREFMDLLDNAGFDSRIADKLAEKRGSIEQNIDHFTNPESGQAGKLPGLSVPKPDGIAGNTSLDDVELTSYRRFNLLCTGDAPPADCDAWEKSLRLIAATSSLLDRYKQPIVATKLDEFDTVLTRYDASWDRYFENRKPQLPWEMAANQFYNREVRTADYFSLPPKSDIVLLHPLLVGTRSDTDDSDNVRLALEVFGINFWDSDNFSGGSIVNFGTDQKIIDTENWGVVFHFGSKYSVGWAEANDDDGFWFASIDFIGDLKKNRDKLAQKEAELKEKLEAIIGELK